MSESLSFFEHLIEERLANLHTCFIARIEKYDPAKLQADIKPLFKKKYRHKAEPVALPVIPRVPVSLFRAGGFVIRPPYKKGDPVLVACAERALDLIMAAGKDEDPKSNRKHALDDAIVIGGLLPYNLDLPGGHAGDLIIAKEDFSSKIVIKESGEIIIEAHEIYLGEGATEGVAFGDLLKSWADNHTHAYNWTSGAGASETSPPSQESPEPSAKVKVE